MNGLSKAWSTFTNFWFAPAEPTTLGFIRVVTGIIMVYTHLVYCFDLNGFFGKHAWYDLDSINRERREYPHVATPFNTWDDMVPSVRVPSQPHRRTAVLGWMQTMPNDSATKVAVIRFFKEIEQLNDPDAPRGIFTYVNLLRSDPVGRKAQLDAIVNESLRSPLDQIPQAVKNLPEKGEKSRERIRDGIERFYDSLPKSDDDRTYVLNYVLESDPFSRLELVNYLERLPADADARKADLEYLSYWGFDRGKTIRQGHPIFSMWYHLSGPTEMAVAHTVVIVIMVLFTLGLWTRVTSVLTWFAAVNYIHRTQYVLFGMDTMSNILLIYLMIGDSGGALSLDRLIARFRAARDSLRKNGSIDTETAAYLAKPRASMSAGLGLRLIQVHFCFIYMAAGLSKLKGPAWWGHQAYWDTTANPEFTMIYFEWYEQALRSLVSNRFLYSITAAIAIAHTFIAEIGLPFLVWTRARPWIVILGVLLHAGIAIFMGLTVFSMLMMLLLLSYIPSAAVRGRLFPERPRNIRLLTFNPKQENQIAVAARALAIDTEGSVELKADPSVSGVRLSIDGKASDTVTPDLLATSNFLSPFAWIPGVKTIAARWLA